MDRELLEKVIELVQSEAERRGEYLNAEQLRNLAEERIRAFVEEADRTAAQAREAEKKTKNALRRLADVVLLGGCIAAIYKVPDLLARGSLKDITITKDET